jgi:periplasmic protein TonB
MKYLIASIILLISFNSYGQTDSSVRKSTTPWVKIEVEASFPGGEGAWTKYITKAITKHIDEITEDGRSGVCIVKFIVDIDSTVTDVHATTMKSSVLAKVAEDAIRKGPKWVPASLNGKKVKAYRYQPITFRLPE